MSVFPPERRIYAGRDVRRHSLDREITVVPADHDARDRDVRKVRHEEGDTLETLRQRHFGRFVDRRRRAGFTGNLEPCPASTSSTWLRWQKTVPCSESNRALETASIGRGLRRNEPR